MSKKICLLVDSLSGGGAEKVAANMSISLTKKGFDVHILSMRNDISYSFSGKLYNFGLVKDSENKLKAFVKFKNFFKHNSFDVVVDHRIRDKIFKEILFSKFVFKNLNVIYCVHSYILSYYFSKYLSKSLFNYQHVKNRKFVSVSKEIQRQLKIELDLDSTLIYNFTLETQSSSQEFKAISIEGDYIVCVGRLQEIKQFDLLINCYKNSKLPEKRIKLLIFGKGEDKDKLNELISNLNLEKQVVLMGFNKDVLAYVKKAKALVLSSKSEGFPMVLIEALALKTPAVSFNCKSGPNEIISHGINGLLVEDQNQEELEKNLNKLLDEKVYSNLKEGVTNWENPFSEENAVKQWVQILENFK